MNLLQILLFASSADAHGHEIVLSSSELMFARLFFILSMFLAIGFGLWLQRRR